MSSYTLDLLLFAGAIHGLLFNVATLVYASRKRITKAILCLNAIILSISLNNIQAWMISREIELPGFLLRHLEVPWYFFVVPMFYCFLLHFLQLRSNSNAEIKGLLVLFATEILVRTAVIGYCYYIVGTVDLIEEYRQIEESVNAAISLFYMYKSYRIVFKRKEEYAFVLSFDTLVWLRNFMRLGGVVFLLWVLAIVLYQHYNSVTMYYPLRIGSTVLIYWIGYQGLIRYSVLKDRIQLRNKIKQNPILPQLSHRHQIGEHTALQQIENCIVGEQLFLDPRLGIGGVAKALGISVSKLSKLISTHRQLHFTDLINTYRVQHAVKLLQDKDFDFYTIEAIGLESGFNSKSAFYNAFKKVFNQTPSAFRNATDS